jgi:hypothetical protein
MRGPRHAVLRNRVIRRTGARSQVRATQEILTRGLAPSHHNRRLSEPYGALALIPIERAAFSYQPKDLKSARRALRDRFLLDTLVRREPTNLPSTFRDTLRFTFVSLGRKRSFSWRHRDIKSMGDSCVK